LTITAVTRFAPACEQPVRVGPTFQHCEVGDTEIAGERGHREQLAGQVLDPHLVLGCQAGQAVRCPHPPIQRGALGPWQLERTQPGRVDQPQTRQGVRVDPVGLGVPRQEPAQIGCFG
jgi:hypothetical protein